MESLYNIINERVIKNKYEMFYLWKYKQDYPADWTHMAEKLSADRKSSDMLKTNIVSLKGKMRQCNAEYNQK